MKGKWEVCKLLVESGANVNAKTPKNRWQQLSVAVSTDEDRLIGNEIVGNIDDNGYLQTTLEEIASQSKSLNRIGLIF